MTSQGTYLSTSEVVKRLRDAGFTVSPAQVRRWVRAGRLGEVRRLPNGRAQVPETAVAGIVTGASV